MPDSEILRCKGPPILNDAERLKLVECVKWVDEVLTGEQWMPSLWALFAVFDGSLVDGCRAG